MSEINEEDYVFALHRCSDVGRLGATVMTAGEHDSHGAHEDAATFAAGEPGDSKRQRGSFR
ncbi:MAG TPA: hypothetical protein VF534_05350 [Paraburkholderia sp.]